MSRLFVLGLSPLPFENQPVVSSLNRRTWHAVRALQEDGHDILLVCVRVHASYRDADSLPRVVEAQIRDNLLYRHVDDRVFYVGKELDAWCDQFQPDAVVGVNHLAAYRASLLHTPAPFWADLNGYQVGEVQATNDVYGEDWHATAWERERTILERADVLSTSSRRQRHAVIGELGAVGRLNRLTAGHELVWPVPNAIEPEPYQHTRTVLRGVLVEPDDFVVLFSGGYNTWTDVDTLFGGLTRAMRRNRRVKFVSTGGAIKGHDERTFAHFRDLIEASPFADRFLFAGWVDTAEVPNYYLESDVGLNVDKFNYETILGARYRLTDMCKAGLPVITSSGTEISGDVSRAGLGLTFRIGDPDGLAEAILGLASDPQRLEQMGARAARYALDTWVYTRVLQPLRTWARAPAHAPDFAGAVPTPSPGAEVMFAPRSRLARLAWRIESEGYARAGKRAARALLRRAATLSAGAARGIVGVLARAFLERRPVPMEQMAAARYNRVVVIPTADVGQTARSLAACRDALPDADIAMLRTEGEALAHGGTLGARAIGAPSDAAGIRGFLALARRLRSEHPDAAVVVGLAGRRAEVLAWLTRAHVYLLGDDANLYVSAVAPWKPLERGARRLSRLLGQLTYASLMGLVIIGLWGADAVAAIVRIARLGGGRTTEV